MPLDLRILRPGDDAVLTRVGDDLFDDPIDAARAAEFLADPRHHIAVAMDDGAVVGFVSAVHYVHPDKPCPELWINEVGVATSHRGRGVGAAVLQLMLDHAHALGCIEAWVLTHRTNQPAMRLYASRGGMEVPPDPVLFAFHLDGRYDPSHPDAPPPA